jgi:hypothetical protein
MSNQSKFHHDYSLATNQLAKQIWYKYPEIVRQCVDHVDFIKDNLLKNAMSGHMGVEQVNYWNDFYLTAKNNILYAHTFRLYN